MSRSAHGHESAAGRRHGIDDPLPGVRLQHVGRHLHDVRRRGPGRPGDAVVPEELHHHDHGRSADRRQLRRRTAARPRASRASRRSWSATTPRTRVGALDIGTDSYARGGHSAVPGDSDGLGLSRRHRQGDAGRRHAARHDGHAEGRRLHDRLRHGRRRERPARQDRRAAATASTRRAARRRS